MRALLLASLAFLTAPSVAPAHMSESAVNIALAPGEVLVEIDAVGRSTVPAQRARLVITLLGRGATAQEARRSVEAEVARVTAAARGAGVAAADIRPVRGLTRVGFIGNSPPGEYEMPSAVQPQLEAGRSATRALEIMVRNPSAADAVREAIDTDGRIVGPEYESADPDGARRAARADAYRRALADAEALAQAANMRLVRVLRISEQMSPEALSAAMMRHMMGEAPSHATAMEVETQVQLSVDFAFAPR